MTITIPVWVLWTAGGALVLVVLALAALGAWFAWMWRSGSWGPRF